MRWGLVVQQPYAQFIAEGWKWTETRGFVPRTTLQPGDDLVIIAGQTNTLGTGAGEHWEPAPHCGGWRMRRVIKGGPHGRRGSDRTELVRLPEVATIPLSFGAAIAVVRYDEALPVLHYDDPTGRQPHIVRGRHEPHHLLICRPSTGHYGGGATSGTYDDWDTTKIDDQYELGIWTPGRSGWLFSNHRKLAHPLAMTREASTSRHMQGVFELTPAAQQWVADELEAG